MTTSLSTPNQSPSPVSHGFKSRFFAMGVHLLLSSAVALAAAALVFLVWYPSPFSEMSGGRELFFLVISVDIVLGPLVTFAIFDRRKPRRELRRDLAIVGLLQVAALLYGMHTVWVVRPAYVVFEVDRFVVIRPVDLDEGVLSKAPDGMKRLPWWGPEYIAAVLPRDPAAAANALALSLQGRDISTQPETWQSYEGMKPEVLKRAKPLAQLQQQQPRHAADIAAFAGRTGVPAERLAYIPVISRQANWVALLDTQTATVVGYLPFGGL